MKKTTKKSLVLSKETLRVLRPNELTVAVGGLRADSLVTSCKFGDCDNPGTTK